MFHICTWKRIQWNRISHLRWFLIDGTGIWLSVMFSQHLGEWQLSLPMYLPNQGFPLSLIISQGRTMKQARKKSNTSSWVSTVELITATIIETYYVRTLFLILTNQWKLKDIFDNVISLLKTLQCHPMSFRGKAKVLTRPYRSPLPVWYWNGAGPYGLGPHVLSLPFVCGKTLAKE